MTSQNAYAETRGRYRLSQAAWAKGFGVSRSSVSAWELGRVPPPPAAKAAYRQLQEPLLRGDMHGVEHWRARMLSIAGEAEREAERLNRERSTGDGLIKVVLVTAAALAIARLLGELFNDDGK